MSEYKRWRKMLKIGTIAAIVTTVLGDMPIGWAVYPETGNMLMDLIFSCSKISVSRMGCATFFGAVFIPLQYYGFKAIAEIISKTGCDRCAEVVEIGAKAYGFGGGTVHVLCVAAMFACKAEITEGVTDLPQNALDFALWMLVPVTVVFMIFYLAMSIAIAVPILKGKTLLPKWAFIFNPLTGKILMNSSAFVLPNAGFFNAIRMGNMGIGSIITYAAFWVLLERHEKYVLNTYEEG